MKISINALASENFDAARTDFKAAVLAVDVADDRHAAGVLATGFIHVPVAGVNLVPEASDCGMNKRLVHLMSCLKRKIKHNAERCCK
eukprot:647145-Pleurochrysis_carterae.AAC.1